MHRTSRHLLPLALSVWIGWAAHAVSGPIFSNQTWDLAGSPWIVDGVVTVTGGAILTIQDGVEVRFDPGTYLEVFNGGLQARALIPGGIQFISADLVTPAPGDWEGLRFLDGAEDAVYSGETYLSGSILENCLVENASRGVLVESSSPYLHDCEIRWCRFTHGGGLTIQGNGAEGARVVGGEIHHCTAESGSGGDGGGVWLDRGLLSDLWLRQNICDGRGGGVYVAGSAVLQSCLLDQNQAATFGGGLAVADLVLPEIRNCQVTRNSVVGTTGLVGGGGIAMGELSLPVVDSCTVADNQVTVLSGQTMGGGIYTPDEENELILTNCILWGNSPDQNHGIGMSHCLVEGGAPGFGILDLDPRFFGIGDYHILPSSPCINMGTNANADTRDLDGEMRPLGNGWDIGADESVGAGGATAACEDISVSTFWSALSSPYLVCSEIVIDPGVLLVIEPGVEVRFDQGAALVVEGEIRAQGTILQPIRFTSNRTGDPPRPGDWGGILFEPQSIDAQFDGTTYLSGCILEGCVIEYAGPGISCTQAAPYIHDSTIQYCLTDRPNGGGIRLDSSSPVVEGNWIHHNQSGGDGQPYPLVGGGGGLYLNLSSPTIRDNRIEDNVARASPAIGGGIHCRQYASAPLVEGNWILRNVAEPNGLSATRGGGIGCYQEAAPYLVNNVIAGNLAEASAGYEVRGGGAYLTGGLVHSCTIVGNQADSEWGEQSGDGVAAEGVVSILNTILWDNGDEVDGAVTMYCDVEDGEPGPWNIQCDPEFFDGGDYHIRASSCARDAGATPVSTPVEDVDGQGRPEGSGWDIGADEWHPGYQTWTPTSTPEPTETPSPGPSATLSPTLTATPPAGPTATVTPTAGPVSCGSYVAGPLSGSVIWDLPGSPYCVTADVTVLEGASLTIESGVVVAFQAGTELQVDGTLVARAAPGQWIRFTSATGAPAPGDWGSLRFSEDSARVVLDGSDQYLSGCILERCLVEYGGPGVLVDFGSPLLDGCRITRCFAQERGGGLYVQGLNSTAVIRNCQLDHNTSRREGGGVFSTNSPYVRFEDLLIQENLVQDSWTCRGGGISTGSQGGSYLRCRLEGNRCLASGFTYQSQGGGAYIDAGSVLRECWLEGNDAGDGNAFQAYGGGVYLADGARLEASLLVGNRCIGANGGQPWGGGAYVSSGGLVTGCTLVENELTDPGPAGSPRGAGACLEDSDQPGVWNCILWGNLGAPDAEKASVPSGDLGTRATGYCNTEDGIPGFGNRSQDPGFIGGGDYHLASGSSCIDSGSILELPPRDGEGENRWRGYGPDIGWDESPHEQFQYSRACADIDQDELWSLSGSPYVVCQTIRIEPDRTLTIEAGVEVRFDQDCRLQVEGEVLAEGYTGQEIRFVSNVGPTSQAPGDWGGLSFEPSSVNATYDVAGYVSGSILSYCLVEHAGPGILVDASSPHIEHSTIRENRSPLNGGGVHITEASHPRLEYCRIEDNLAGELLDGYGGGLYWSALSDPLLTDCQVEANQAQKGGGIYIDEDGAGLLWSTEIRSNLAGSDSYVGIGGGLFAYRSSPELTGCTLTDNRALRGPGTQAARGAGIYLDWIREARVDRCILSGNVAGEGIVPSGAAWGGGICIEHYQFGYQAEISNCFLVENQVLGGFGALSEALGGAIYLSSAGVSPLIHSCTLVNNLSSTGSGGTTGGAHANTGVSATLTNCLLWGNGHDSENLGLDSCHVEELGAPDPLLMGGSDYHIQAGSPCENAGSSVAAPDHDFDGEWRPQDGLWDIGADEIWHGEASPTPTWSPTVTPTSTFTVTPTMTRTPTPTSTGTPLPPPIPTTGPGGMGLLALLMGIALLRRKTT